MIVDDYVDACTKYTAKYGETTVCLFQIGDFFEMNAYYVDSEAGNVLMGADIYKVCDICNLIVTRKNKSVVDTSRSNPLMAGFPLAALPKYSSILLANSYTVVVVRQISQPPNVVREVTEILSPSTIIAPSTSDANNLMCIVFDPFMSASHKSIMTVGISIIDISTGRTWAYESYSSSEDPNFSYDEVNRLIEAYAPREIYILKSKLCADPATNQSIDNCVMTNQALLHTCQVSEEIKPAFQEAVMQRAYDDGDGYTSVQGTLGNYALARIAFTGMLQFAYDHNDTVIKKLQVPIILEQAKYLNLESTSALQLQVVSSSASARGETPLLALLNRCVTAFGRRYFKERLLTPLRDVSTISRRYDAIDQLLDAKKYISVSKHLARMSDVERMARRMRLGTFSPMEWCSLHDSLEAAVNAITSQEGSHAETSTVNSIYAMQKQYDVLDLREASKYTLSDIKGSVFKQGYNTDIDAYNEKLRTSKDTLEAFQAGVSAYEPCNLDSNERDGFFLSITKKRWEAVRRKCEGSRDAMGVIAGIKLVECDVRPVSATSSVLKITHTVLDEASTAISTNQRILQSIVTQAYMRFVADFDTRWHGAMQELVVCAGDLDVAATCARNAVEYGYVRPTLGSGSGSDSGSFIRATKMRHPIIERIHTDVEYVPNNVSLGNRKLDDNISKGMLLYGINASGKSSYMKAVGLNVILAQAGMFVAAEAMDLAPFHSIFTRIQNNDNVYKRMSSFTVEMTELRNIFQRCNKYSLVLGDELCAGTEFISAISIVASGTYNLVTKNVTFVFATHLHEMIDVPLIKDIPKEELRIAHIHVDVGADGSIKYDRTLREGSGSAVYGLEVCQALGMPSEFVQVAHSVRKHIQGISMGHGIVDSLSSSKYNSCVYMENEICKVCNINKAEEVHHIKYRSEGGSNRSSNLVPLCKSCHDHQHNGNLNIKGYVATPTGRSLEYCWELDSHKASVGFSVSQDGMLVDKDIEALKMYVQYTAAGWMIKRTNKSRWIPILHDSVIVYIQKKIDTSRRARGADTVVISADDMTMLKNKLLVV